VARTAELTKALELDTPEPGGEVCWLRCWRDKHWKISSDHQMHALWWWNSTQNQPSPDNFSTVQGIYSTHDHKKPMYSKVALWSTVQKTNSLHKKEVLRVQAANLDMPETIKEVHKNIC
ncbi:hypothetical protein DOY81_003240, partial [Sarcophaga bullata]